jgi:hypothetical protein
MDGSTFDRLTLTLTTTRARRRVLPPLVAGLLVAIAQPAAAKSKKKRRPKPNEFGCLNVGQRCRGNSDRCCSGICEGKKPKKGKKDRSRCVGHDIAICTQGVNACVEAPGPATECNPADPDCDCYITTGNSGFCGTEDRFQCRACSRDKDCVDAGFPPGSACIRATGPACVACALQEFTTACVGPCGSA